MTHRKRLSAIATLVILALAAAPAVPADGKGRAIVTPQPDLKWTESGIPGVTSATVDGDMAKGSSRFYLKYAAGLNTPLHHHSPDHFVTTVSGTLVLVVDGKEHRLAPGSYFALTGKVPHAARCEGAQDCLMFIEARGAWDVVPEEKSAR